MVQLIADVSSEEVSAGYCGSHNWVLQKSQWVLREFAEVSMGVAGVSKRCYGSLKRVFGESQIDVTEVSSGCFMVHDVGIVRNRPNRKRTDRGR